VPRNVNIRKMAEKLPPYPQLIGRKIQRDSEGNIIYKNHFRALKKIQYEMEGKGFNSKSEEVFAAYNVYIQSVLHYDSLKNKKGKLGIGAIIIIIIAIIYALIYLITGKSGSF